MIVFDLKCEKSHQFESWFRSSAAYEEQKAAGLVACPYCDSTQVSKAPMAPNVAAKGNQRQEKMQRAEMGRSNSEGQISNPLASKSAKGSHVAAAPVSPEMEKLIDKAVATMRQLQEHVEANCDNVGDQFVEEARKIHYGEAEERGIYGNASLDEAQELLDEGIDLMPLPTLRRTDA